MWIFNLIKVFQYYNTEESVYETQSMMRLEIVIYQLEEWSVSYFSSLPWNFKAKL